MQQPRNSISIWISCCAARGEKLWRTQPSLNLDSFWSSAGTRQLRKSRVWLSLSFSGFFLCKIRSVLLLCLLAGGGRILPPQGCRQVHILAVVLGGCWLSILHPAGCPSSGGTGAQGRHRGAQRSCSSFHAGPTPGAVAFQAGRWGNISEAGQSMPCGLPVIARLFQAVPVPGEQWWLQVGCHTTHVPSWEVKGVTLPKPILLDQAGAPLSTCPSCSTRELRSFGSINIFQHCNRGLSYLG